MLLTRTLIGRSNASVFWPAEPWNFIDLSECFKMRLLSSQWVLLTPRVGRPKKGGLREANGIISGTETIPNQSSQAAVVQQTCRGSFSAVPKQIFGRSVVDTHFAAFFEIARLAHFWTAPNSKLAEFCITTVTVAKSSWNFEKQYIFRWVFN